MLGAAAPKEMVILVSEGGDSFELEKSIANQSQLVATLTSEPGEGSNSVPIASVKTATLAKVIEFLKHHAEIKLPEIEKPLRSADFSQVVPDWDAKYVDCEQELLFDLILAANFMDIKSLLDLACAKVASMIKGKTPEEIRKTFGIRNDFTTEEESVIREENKWCEE